MTQEVNSESSTTSCSAPLKHSKEPGYIYDTLKKRWVADTRDGKRICNQCKTRRDVDWFTGNKQKAHTCKECRRYIKASQRYKITYEEAKQLYSEPHCQCCNIQFDSEMYLACIHHLENGDEIVVRGIVCKQCNWLLRDESVKHRNRIECCLKWMDEGKV